MSSSPIQPRDGATETAPPPEGMEIPGSGGDSGAPTSNDDDEALQSRLPMLSSSAPTAAAHEDWMEVKPRKPKEKKEKAKVNSEVRLHSYFDVWSVVVSCTLFLVFIESCSH